MNYSRILTGTRGIVAAAGALSLTAMLPAPARRAVPNYDGIWSVVILTKPAFAIRPTAIRSASARGTCRTPAMRPVQITGKVGKNGALTVNVIAGNNTATGTGRLSGKTGSGSWSGGNGACEGVWQAERRS